MKDQTPNPQSVTVVAPAKLNLTLDITGLAENGYHLVDMLMQTVSLYERVRIEKDSGLTVTLPHSYVPGGKNNTAYQAAVAFFQHTGLLAGAKITIYKSVPVRAGMAGGSADAAAVLVGLNDLYHAKLSMDELCEIGLTVGADVPFSIKGGTMRVTGIGEVMEPLPSCPRCWFTVVMPQAGVSTPQAYALYDEKGTDIRPDNEGAVQALQEKDLSALCRSMGNALQFSSPSAHNQPICTQLMECGALAAQMTGSGAAVFGVFATEQQAQHAKEVLSRSYRSCWVLHPVRRGAHIPDKPSGAAPRRKAKRKAQ